LGLPFSAAAQTRRPNDFYLGKKINPSHPPNVVARVKKLLGKK
jgi:hypothetical protein